MSFVSPLGHMLFAVVLSASSVPVQILIEEDPNPTEILCEALAEASNANGAGQVSAADFKGLRTLEKMAGKKIRKIMVYTGPSPQRFGEESAFPYEQFLGEVLPAIE